MPEARISAIGGARPDGTPWRLNESAAIAGVEAGTWAFHVERPSGEIAPLGVATRNGRKYLKADLDDEMPGILFALPECAPIELVADTAALAPTAGRR